ncbi:MAG: hypothetical protein ACOCUU_01490 [Nanoarchaeota archaeon]
MQIKSFLENLFKNKKSQTDTQGRVMFFLLNIAFFSILLIWVWSASNGAFIYEEAYAKEISFIADKGKPGMHFELDFSKALKKGEKNNIPKEKMISVDNKENTILVKLSDRGFEYKFFTDSYIQSYVGAGKNLVIYICENEEICKSEINNNEDKNEK